MTRLFVSYLVVMCPANLFAYTEWSLYLNVLCIEPMRYMFVIAIAELRLSIASSHIEVKV